MQVQKISLFEQISCPCCGLNYKLINGQTDKSDSKYRADNKHAQKLYKYRRERFYKKNEPLYFFAIPKILQNGSMFLKCEKCEGEFVLSSKGEILVLSSQGEREQ